MNLGTRSFLSFALVLALVIAASSASGEDSGTQKAILKRLEQLEASQARLENLLVEKEKKIAELELAVGAPQSNDISPSGAADDTSGSSSKASQATLTSASTKELPKAQEFYGTFNPGRGFEVARTPLGELSLSGWTYLRYLNQRGLDEQYTDHLGRERSLDLRNDLQIQKVMLFTKGWLFDPNFRYSFYTWTNNSNQGGSAQVVLAGFVNYVFDRSFVLAAGISGYPSTRSMNGQFPFFMSVDKRTLADEFFRGSFSTGVWAEGEAVKGLKYKFMVGNNLSQLGVDSGQLDGDLSTFGGGVWWMPTTGEYGPKEGYGDFEEHQEVATLLGVNFTRSREDRQSQPSQNDPENSQIRLSDGTVLFAPGAFGTDGRVNKASFYSAAVSGGIKYRGFSIDTEYFARVVDDFSVEGVVPEESLFDQGFQLQTSMMVMPETLQLYGFGSKVFGEYGQPWDLGAGVSWYPFRTRNFRLNTEYIYLDNSPVGNNSLPLVVGGNGSVVHSNLEVMF